MLGATCQTGGLKARKRDCEGVKVNADILFKSPQDLEKEMERDSKSRKRDKLDDLRNQLDNTIEANKVSMTIASIST